MRDLNLSRRRVLAGAALLAAPAIIGRARAADPCVVGTWGGDYARLLRENIDEPILKPAGIEIVQDIGDESPRVAKLYAQKKLARGTVDIACVGALNGYRVTEGGLVEDLDDTKVPNLKHVQPDLRMPGFVPHIAGAGVQSGHGKGTAEDDERSARSEMERQDRHGRHDRIMGPAGGQSA
jgi:putative spermidine/putrescine transport system substrate-binding protein